MSNPFVHQSGGYKSDEEIKATWQARALRASTGKLQHVLFIAMVNEYTAVTQDTWFTLLRMMIPGFEDISRPFLVGYASIVPSGRVVSEVIDKDYGKRMQVVYRNKDEFLSEMRRLADRLKLDDDERRDMFNVLSKWITVDHRVGVNGEKLAS